MNWIETNGVGLRYELCGQGKRTIVLIHEMGGTLETWDLVFPRLCQKYRVLRYDMRGAGLSEKVRGNLTVETLADDLLALLEALGIAGRVILAGCAVGAAVAICFAGRHKERTGGLVAMSPSVGVAEDQRQARLKRIERLADSGMRSIISDAFTLAYPDLLQARDPSRFKSFRARWLGNDPTSLAAIYRMLIFLELGKYMQNISCPTLVVGGTHDAVRTPASSEKVAMQIPGARFRVLETGHHMPVQTPEFVYEVIAEFIDEVVPGI
jgi:3-oxoadipate enol-lactonase